MKLVKLELQNFRVYKKLKVNFNDKLNVLIGKNDVGKSTILDAMNLFFNDDAKIEPSDCNIEASEKEITISAIFKVPENEPVILDATNPTTLKDEFLLNKDGLLEVRKVINAGGKSVTKSNISVYLNANQPEISEKSLITYKSTELKKLVEEHKDNIKNYQDINKTKKADMRQALHACLINENTNFDEILINVKDIHDDSINTWDKLKENLPIYNLFQSDRSNTDGDKEVQDPMKAITKEVLVDLQNQLNEIRDEVVARVEEVGSQTIEKLREFNADIANELKTVPELKNWDSIFKFSLETDNDIPLNKRGSGVRRLILLSYFRAQAEKHAQETGNNDIIYAIEEPETSQHPDYQKMIVESLMTIANQNGKQVFITTHTPEIAQMVADENLIIVKRSMEGEPDIIEDTQDKIREIVNTLGILPDIHSKLVICVEGKNDVNFLTYINEAVPEYREIIDLKNSDISIFDVGGSRLIDWINKNHLDNSNIKEFHLYDGDNTKYSKIVKKMNEENDERRKGIIIEAREMENYIPPSAIEEHFDCDLSEHYDRWTEFDIPRYLNNIVMQHINDENERLKAIKGILNSSIIKNITAKSLKEFGLFEEIENWFHEINSMYRSTVTEKIFNV